MPFKGRPIPRAEAQTWYEAVKKFLVAAGLDPFLIEVGGSVRRGKEIVGDIDLAIFDDQKVNKAFYRKVCDLLVAAGHTVDVRAMGDVQASVRVDGVLFEFKKAPPASRGAMKLHITGSGDFNLGMRTWVKARGFMLNQYGLYDAETGEMFDSTTEQGIFAKLGLEYVEPKNRDQFVPTPVAGSPVLAYAPAKDKARKAKGIPAELLANLPKDVRVKVEQFVLPAQDAQGIPIPADFLWNAKARQRYYIRSGIWKREHAGLPHQAFKIPDELKLNRYVAA